MGVAIAVAALVAGCGIGTQSEPEPIAPEDVPFGLLDPPAETVSPNEPAGVPFVVYFVTADGTALTPAVRTAFAPASTAAVLRALVTGPTETEAASGLSTALPPDTTARPVVVTVDLAVIELGGGFGDVSGEDAVTAMAQIVFTVTEAAGVGSVQFRLDDEPLEVPRGDGALTSAPVERSDYPDLAP